jgi:hypothetical protein
MTLNGANTLGSHFLLSKKTTNSDKFENKIEIQNDKLPSSTENSAHVPSSTEKLALVPSSTGNSAQAVLYKRKYCGIL